MKGIGIHDLTGSGLAFDLRELLGARGPRGRAAWWRACTPVWYIGEGAIPALDVGEPPGPWIRGSDLMDVDGLTQVVDGVLESVEEPVPPTGNISPWVVLRAVDSSWWEVYSDDSATLAAVRSRFTDVRPAQYTPNDPATDY